MKSIYQLAFFKKVTVFDRWFEIGLGILFWMNIIILLYILLKHLSYVV